MFRFCPSPRGCVVGVGSQKKTEPFILDYDMLGPAQFAASLYLLVLHNLQSHSPHLRAMVMTVITHSRPVSHLTRACSSQRLWLQ